MSGNAKRETEQHWSSLSFILVSKRGVQSTVLAFLSHRTYPNSSMNVSFQFFCPHPLSAADDASSDIHPHLARALCLLLRSRPAYFDLCLADVCAVRRASLVRRFGLALTRGSQTAAVGATSSSAAASSSAASSNASGGARPIDLHAHDPFRYVSDMLAWVHQVR